MDKKGVIVLLICFIIVYGAFFLGIYATGEIQSKNLHIFGLALTNSNMIYIWSVFNIFLVISLYQAWKISGDKHKKVLFFVFANIFFYSAAWVFIFFELNNPHLGIADLFLLFASLSLASKVMKEIDEHINMYLLAYLLWIAVVATINYRLTMPSF